MCDIRLCDDKGIKFLQEKLGTGSSYIVIVYSMQVSKMEHVCVWRRYPCQQQHPGNLLPHNPAF